MAASVVTTMAVQLEIISPFQLYFNPKLIFNSHQVSCHRIHRRHLVDLEKLVDRVDKLTILFVLTSTTSRRSRSSIGDL